MTYLQTEYFLRVAQNKSITKTSADLYVSPPAISKQIALLEEELGIKLFVRGAKGMGPAAGTAVAFTLYPTQMEELLRVADEGRLMPPKSTWFEPKLMSGILIHEI